MSIRTSIIKIKPSQRMKARQRGFSLIGVSFALSVLSAGAVLYAQQLAQEQVRTQVQVANEDVTQLQEALYAYHMDNRSFPSPVSCESLPAGCVVQYLKDQGYYFGSVESPFGSAYDIALASDSNSALVTFHSTSDRLASRTARTFHSGVNEGSRVNIPVGRPSREAVLNTFLHRTAQDDCPECNTMETSINMSGNDISNVGTLYAESIDAEELNAIRINADEFNVENSIQIGDSEIAADGSGIAINASNVSFTGGVSIAGNLESQGGDFTGFSSIETDSLSAQSGTIGSLVATDFEAETAQIDSANIATLSGTSLDFQSGNFNSFETGELQAATANIAELSGTSLNYGSGTVSALNATSAQVTTLDAAQANLGTLNVSGGVTAGTFNVSGTMNAGSGQFANVRAGSLVANSGRFSSYHADNATFGSLSVSNSLNAQSVNVSGRLEADTANVDDVDFSSGSFQSMSVNGQLTANSLTANNSTIGNLTFTTATGGSITISGDVSGRRGTFTQDVTAGNGVFTNASSSRSSINENHDLIQNYIQAWNACVSAGGCQ